MATGDGLGRVGLDRLVDVRGAGKGSGYAVGADLLVTAGHVVVDRDRCSVRLHGSDVDLEAVVVWRGDEIDVALLRVDEIVWHTLVTQWGQVSGVRPVACRAAGYPWVQRQSDGVRAEEVVVGTVVPGTTYRLGRYAFNVASSLPYDPDDGKSPWRGMSGAGLTTDDDGVLLGVLVDDPTVFEPSRLEAVPVAVLLADPTFAAVVGVDADVLVSVPDHPFLQPVAQLLPLRPTDPQLLMPKFGVVPFIGRSEVVDTLITWATGSDLLDVALVIGQGGSGKTRLAAWLCQLLLARGWDAGRLDKPQ